MFSADRPARASRAWSSRCRLDWTPDELGGGAVAQPGQLLLDVADQLPRCRSRAAPAPSRPRRPAARGTTPGCRRPRRRGGGRGLVGRWGSPPPAGLPAAAGSAPRGPWAGTVGDRRGVPGGPGPPVRPRWDVVLVGLGHRVEARHRPEGHEQDLQGLGPTVHADAEGLVEAGQHGADEPDDQLGVFGRSDRGRTAGPPPGRAGGSEVSVTTGRADGRAGRPEPGALLQGRLVEATQVSLLVPSLRLEMTRVSRPAPTRVSPPGRTLYPWPKAPEPCSSATAKVRRTVGRGSMRPGLGHRRGQSTGSMISWPTQAPGRARIRSRRSSRAPASRAEPPPAAGSGDGRTGSRIRSRARPARGAARRRWPHHQVSGPRRASSSPNSTGARLVEQAGQGRVLEHPRTRAG